MYQVIIGISETRKNWTAYCCKYRPRGVWSIE